MSDLESIQARIAQNRARLAVDLEWQREIDLRAESDRKKFSAPEAQTRSQNVPRRRVVRDPSDGGEIEV